MMIELFEKTNHFIFTRVSGDMWKSEDKEYHLSDILSFAKKANGIRVI